MKKWLNNYFMLTVQIARLSTLHLAAECLSIAVKH